MPKYVHYNASKLYCEMDITTEGWCIPQHCFKASILYMSDLSISTSSTELVKETIVSQALDVQPGDENMALRETRTNTTYPMMLKCRKKRAVTGFRPPPGGPQAQTNTTSIICRNCKALRSYLEENQ